MRRWPGYERAFVALLPLLMVGPTACQVAGDPESERDDEIAAAGSALEEPTCVTLKRGAAGDVHDTFLSGDYPGWAPGDDYNLYIGGSSGGNVNYALYGFDLSPIPADASVESATFDVHISWSEDPGPIEVHRITIPWSEASARTSNFDTVNGIDASVVDAFPAGDGGGWRSADVTALVAGWQNGSLPSHGFALAEDPAHHHHTYSSESSAAYRPSLTVCYTEPPPEPTCAIAPADQEPRSFVMSKRIGGDGSDDYPLGVAVAGNDTVVAGYFANLAVVGGAVLQTTSPADRDIFVAKLDDAGHALWAKRFGDATSQSTTGINDPRDGAHAVAVAPDGTVIVAGGFAGTVDFGTGPLTSPSGGHDIFVAAFDAAGNALWSRSFGGATGNGRARGVTVAPDGKILVAGGFSGAIDFGGGALSQPSLTGDEDGLFVLMLDAAGEHLWSHATGNATSPTRALDAKLDAAGNVLVTGLFGGTIDVGTGPLTALGLRDVLVTKLDPSGTPLWARRYGDGTDGNGDRGVAIAADSTGAIHVTGVVDGPVSFGGATEGSQGNSRGFLLKLTPDGDYLSDRRFGPTSDNGSQAFGTGVAVDAADSVFVLGWASTNSMNLGGGLRTAQGSLTSYVARYSSDGAHLWSRLYGTLESTFAQGLAVDCGGHALATGWFNSQLDFGGHLHQSTNNNQDVFVAKLSPVNEVDTDGDGYTDPEDTCPAIANVDQRDLDADREGDVCDASPNDGGHGAVLWNRLASSGSSPSSIVTGRDPSGATVLTGAGTNLNFGGGSLGAAPLYLAKLDASGAHAWSKSFGSVLGTSGRTLAFDAASRVVVGGVVTGTGAIDFGGGSLPAGGGSDAVVAMFDADGNHQWSKRWGDGANQSVDKVAVDATGNIYVAGTFQGNIDTGAGRTMSAGQNDLFLAKLSPAGFTQWARFFGDPANQATPTLTIDSAGNPVIAGRFSGTVHFGNGVFLTSQDPSDMYLVKLDPNGNPTSAVRIPAPTAGASFTSLAIDGGGNLLAAGTFARTGDAGGGLLTTDENGAVIVAKYSLSGQLVYDAAFPTDLSPTAILAVDAAGFATVAGQHQGSIEVDADWLRATKNRTDAYIARLDPSGGVVYTRRYGTDGIDFFTSVSSDPTGNATLSGVFTNGTMDFGAGPLTSGGSMVLLQLSP